MLKRLLSRMQLIVTYLLVFAALVQSAGPALPQPAWGGTAVLAVTTAVQGARFAEQPGEAPSTIEIGPTAITPEMLEVMVGEPVTIVNNDSRARTIRLSSEDDAGAFWIFLPLLLRPRSANPTAAPAGARGAAGATSANEETITLGAGESVQRAFDRTGNVVARDVENAALAATILVTPRPLAKAGAVLGTVLDYETKAAIAGAQVKALGTDLHSTTDAQGGYSLLLPPGDYTLVMYANGYTFANRQVSVQPYAPVGVDTTELVPLDPVVTAIGSAGGTAANADENTNIAFAAGAVTTTKPVRLTVLEVDEFSTDFDALPGPFTDGSVPLGFVMFEPDGTSFAAEAVWTIAYDGPLPVGSYVPCYYWIEDEARWGDPVDGEVVDLENGQKGLRATLPHFSAYGFASQPPPEKLPPAMPDTPEDEGPLVASNHPDEGDHDRCLGSQINLMSGELCQTVGTAGLPSLGGLPTQITAKYHSRRVAQKVVVSTTIGIQPNSVIPTNALWTFGIAGHVFEGVDTFDVSVEWDGNDINGNPVPPGVHDGVLNAVFGYTSSACPGKACSIASASAAWPVHVVRDDLSPFGVGWFGPHDTLLVDNGKWVTIVQGDGRQVAFEKLDDDRYEPPTGDFSSLTRDSAGIWTRAYPDGSALTFNADGRLIRIEDRYGNFQHILYESNGKVVPEGQWGLTTRVRRITDTSGNSFDYAYGDDGWLDSITDSAGRTYRFEHDAQGHLSAFIDPLGQRRTFTYDADGRMTGHTDKRGYTTTYALDAEGRVVTRSWPTGTDLQVRYGERRVGLTLDNGAPLVTMLDEDYSPVARYNGVYTATTTYNAELLPETRTDVPLTTLYDENGQVIELVAASVLQLERDGAFDQVSRANASDGTDTRYAYDAQGNLVGFTDVLGQSYSLTYDTHGQPQTITDPLGHTVTVAYDGRGQVTQLTDPLGQVWEMKYDPAGNLDTLTDPEGQVTTMTYDDLNRLQEIVDALGGVVGMDYDANGNLTAISDPTGRAIAYGYDRLNRMTDITYADGGVERYSYDGSGNLTRLTDARGQVINWSYDAANRVTEKQVVGGPSVAYSYDNYDQPTRIDDGVLSTELAYVPDTLGLPTRETQTATGLPLDVSLNYAYSGRLINHQRANATAAMLTTEPNVAAGDATYGVDQPSARPAGRPTEAREGGSAPAVTVAGVTPLAPMEVMAPQAVTALTCDAMHSGSITTTQTLDLNAGGVHCFSNVIIEPGVTLTVPAGVQFAAEAGDLVIRGALVLAGEAGNPAILTSRRNGPYCTGCGNDYRVIVEQDGQLDAQHAEIRYAGYVVQPQPCQLTLAGNARVVAQDSVLGVGGVDQMACVTENASFYANGSTLGQPGGPEPLNVNSTGLLSVTHSTLLAVDGTGQQGLRINLSNVGGLVNGGNVFSNTTGAPMWISVYGSPSEITGDTTWNGMDTSTGLTGLFFEAGATIRNNATLTVRGPWVIRGAGEWAAGYSASNEGGHLRLLGTPDKRVAIYANSGYAGVTVYANGTLETAHANLNGGGANDIFGAIVSVRNGGQATLQATDVHHGVRNGVYVGSGGSAAISDSRVHTNAFGGIVAHPEAGPISVSNSEVYNHTDPAQDAVAVPLSSAGDVGPGVTLHDNARDGVRIYGALTADATLAPVPGGYYYNRSFDPLVVSGGGRLTLAPDTVLRLSGRLHVDGGHLVAAGAPTGTVRLTSLGATWEGLVLRNGGDATLTHALLEHSSQDGILQESSGGSLQISNALIAGNAGWGLAVDNPGAGVTVTHSSFTGNGEGGVLNSRPGDGTVEATRDYWGVASGPASGATGPGQMASEGVNAAPWSAAFVLPGDGRLSNVRVTSNGNRPQEETYRYDASGRLTSLSSRGYSTFTLGYAYDAADRLLARTPQAGTPLSYTYGYDAAGRLTELAIHGPDGLMLSETYTYDAAGNVVRVVSSRDGTTDYNYDPLYRLTGVSSAALSESYSYDAAGNRTSAGGVTYTYDAGGRVESSSDGTSYAYDAAGNLSSKTENGQTTTYAWDGQNRLQRIDYPDGRYSAYGYDDFGRRISKRSPDGKTVYYAYIGLNLAQELDSNGEVLASYTYDGLDRPISMWRDGQTYVYLLDRLGSVLGLVDETGSLVASYRYDPWGNLISSTGALENPLRFTARECDDESGLYYYRARYYDPQAGRFIGRDPIGVAGGLNLYAYVGNDPVNRSDPSGLVDKFYNSVIESKLQKAAREHTDGNKPHPIKLSDKTAEALREKMSEKELDKLKELGDLMDEAKEKKDKKEMDRIGKQQMEILEDIAKRVMNDAKVDKRIKNELSRIKKELSKCP